MKQDEKTFRDTIEEAERHLLVWSWIGTAAATGLLLYSVLAI